MTVLFDEESGRLRLDRSAFDALATLARGGEKVDKAGLAELRAAGAVKGRQPHPVLVTGLGAVADPVCWLRLDLVDAAGRTEQGEGWVSGDAAALLLDLPGQLCELVVAHPTFLPAGLARIVRLGPRPRPASAEPVQVPHDLPDRLTSADRTIRRAAVDELADVSPIAARSLAELRQAWQIRVHWSGPGHTIGARAVRVLDTAAGLWLVERGDGTTVLWPTTPTAVWRAFVLLLPRDTELA